VDSVISNVLIVEADDHTLRARGDELLLDGYEVLAAQTGAAARERLADGAPDALILGTLENPAASLQLLRDLRAGAIARADSRLPVLSTAADTDHQAVRHYQAGSDIALPSTASPLLIAAGLKGLAQRQGTTTRPSRRQPDRRLRRPHRDHRRPTRAALSPRVRPPANTRSRAAYHPQSSAAR
jgi:DNA-binding response OmpR family regulator